MAGVAMQCAETFLALDDVDQAAEVVRRALNTVPLHTELTECLMRCHAAGGDLRAVHTVYRSHVEALRTQYDCDPEQSTIEVYRDLTRERTNAGADDDVLHA